MGKKVVLTGMRTTGALHLGHYVGALKQWKEIQDAGEYECFFLLADVQALTTHVGSPSLLTQSVRDVALDWLSVGLNPELSHVHFVLQSQVPERYELSVLLGMVARYSEVMRDPTLKTEMSRQPNATMGFVYYPVDQAADIYMVCPVPPRDGDQVLVPVGQDQLPHLELAREIARDFNAMYGETFTPCSGLVGEIGRLVGTDGKDKMSKSLGNAIFLSDRREVVEAKIKAMVTDPTGNNPRLKATDPGIVEGNPVFLYHDAFNANLDEVAELKLRYLEGRVGDSEVKQLLAVAVNEFLDPIRDRRAEFESARVRYFLEEGTKTARKSCSDVVSRVRNFMHLYYPTHGY